MGVKLSAELGAIPRVTFVPFWNSLIKKRLVKTKRFKLIEPSVAFRFRKLYSTPRAK